jgi:ABC-2 type transport system ATP-binding protein
VLLASHLLAEVVQTADRVLIIARGRALREADVASLDGAVELAVRVDDPESLAGVLAAQEGVEVSATGDGRLVVRGATAEEVGRTAARIGATVFELSSRSAGASLEHLYLSLIGDEEREVA